MANAAFNNLGALLPSTALSWGRATLGTIPFAYWGSHYGPGAVLVGQAAAAVVFGSLAVLTAFAVARRIETQPPVSARPATANPVTVTGD